MNQQGMEFIKDIAMEMRPKIRYWLPCAAVDETDLREEIRQMKERGFGGIEVVTLASVPEQIARGDEGWGSDNWHKTVGVIADETLKQGMSMDLAIGPGWPIVSLVIQNAQDEAAAVELTYGEICVPAGEYFEGSLPVRRIVHEEGIPKLVAVMAYEETQEKVLKRKSFLDLSGYVKKTADGSVLCCDFPANEAGVWKVFAFYQQPTAQKMNSGQSYVIDHLSKKGVQACEKYWEKVWNSNVYSSQESIFCDSLEYETAFDWSHGFAEEFEARRGYSILPYLPVIGLNNLYPSGDLPGYRFSDPLYSDQINHDYLEVQTQLYCENHLNELEQMAEKHGKTIRYQVAYNKPFEVERSALCVAVPENEALGRPAIDSLKAMASSVHLGRKKRYSFECAAEFGNAYGQCYEDLFWWVKRGLMAGMNAQVLHGGSYSGKYTGKYSEEGQIPGVSWPGYAGFYGFISNDWNRTLSLEDARGCMDAIARLNAVFRKNARIDCAILKNTYCNDGLGSEFYIYPDGGQLMNYGYSYEFLSEMMLELPVCRVSNGRMDEDGPAYTCLIIDHERYASLTLLLRIQKLAESGFPVVWIGDKPIGGRFYSEVNSEEKRELWNAVLEKTWNADTVIHVSSRNEVPEILKKRGVMPEVMLDGKRDIMTAVHEDDKIRYIALYAYNRVEYTPDNPNPDEFGVSALFGKTNKSSYQRPGKNSRGTVSVSIRGTGSVWICNPWTGNSTQIVAGSLECQTADNQTGCSGYRKMAVDIEEDEMILLAVSRETGDCANSEVIASLTQRNDRVGEILFDTLELEEFCPNEYDEVSFLRSGFRKWGEPITIDKLRPWNELDSRLQKFAGRGIYHGKILLEKKMAGQRYFLKLGEVCDTFQVWVNDKKADFPDQVMKEVEVTNLLEEGENKLRVIVHSNLYNRLLEEGMVWKGNVIPYTQKKYGICDTEEKPVCLVSPIMPLL